MAEAALLARTFTVGTGYQRGVTTNAAGRCAVAIASKPPRRSHSAGGYRQISNLTLAL
jgi:hypothetical protein